MEYPEVLKQFIENVFAEYEEEIIELPSGIKYVEIHIDTTLGFEWQDNLYVDYGDGMCAVFSAGGTVESSSNIIWFSDGDTVTRYEGKSLRKDLLLDSSIDFTELLTSLLSNFVSMGNLEKDMGFYLHQI